MHLTIELPHKLGRFRVDTSGQQHSWHPNNPMASDLVVRGLGSIARRDVDVAPYLPLVVMTEPLELAAVDVETGEIILDPEASAHGAADWAGKWDLLSDAQAMLTQVRGGRVNARLPCHNTNEAWWISTLAGPPLRRVVGYTFDRYDVIGRHDGQWSIDVSSTGGAFMMAANNGHVSLDSHEPHRAVFDGSVRLGPTTALAEHANKHHLRWISCGPGRVDRRAMLVEHDVGHGKWGDSRVLEVRRCQTQQPAWTIYFLSEPTVELAIGRVRSSFAAQDAALRLAMGLAEAMYPSAVFRK